MSKVATTITCEALVDTISGMVQVHSEEHGDLLLAPLQQCMNTITRITTPRQFEIPDDIKKMLEGVIGCVEANSFEHHSLWKEWNDKNNGHHSSYKGEWKSATSGIGICVGYAAGNKDMPVYISMNVDTIKGHKILFYYATSRYTDSQLVREYLEKVMPKSGFRPDGEYLNNTDAMNFHNVFPRDMT